MTNTATEPQKKFLTDLLTQQASFNRDRSVAMWNELRDLEGKGELTFDLVSKRIDAVKQAIRVQARTEEGEKLLASTKRVEVPEGRYAVRDTDDEGKVRFYRVKRYEGGAVLVFVQAGDDEHRIYKGAMHAVLKAIVQAGIEESLVLYGKEIGVCGKCGRTLTDDESRARGIGPVCAGKL